LCVHANCTNLISKSTKNLCKDHGNGITCTFDNCYNVGDPILMLCANHIKYHRCKTVACTSPLKLGSEYCHFHARNSRCPNCRDWIDSQKGSKEYDGYCARCFKRCFPEDQRSKVIHSKDKEIKVRNFLNANYQGFIHNTPIYTPDCDCTIRRRVDHYCVIGNTIIAVETDEHQHKDYDKLDETLIRYNDFYMHFSGKWIFIRFNVHSYMLDGKLKLTKLEERFDTLKNEIDFHISRAEHNHNKELLEVHKLYYDCPPQKA